MSAPLQSLDIFILKGPTFLVTSFYIQLLAIGKSEMSAYCKTTEDAKPFGSTWQWDAFETQVDVDYIFNVLSILTRNTSAK